MPLVVAVTLQYRDREGGFSIDTNAKQGTGKAQETNTAAGQCNCCNAAVMGKIERIHDDIKLHLLVAIETGPNCMTAWRLHTFHHISLPGLMQVKAGKHRHAASIAGTGCLIRCSMRSKLYGCNSRPFGVRASSVKLVR